MSQTSLSGSCVSNIIKYMQYKISFKSVLLISGAVGTAIFLIFVLFFNTPIAPAVLNSENAKLSADSDFSEIAPLSDGKEPLKNSINDNLAESMRAFISPGQIGAELPINLRIPAINVDVKIGQVGIKADGEMDIPKNPSDAAWFNLGPRPGDTGSAVISGHYGWKNGIRAVFDNLHKLKIGDKIFTEDEKGGVTTFIVREIRSYGDTDAAPDVFTSNDGKSHLNLITCEGIWNAALKSYSKRLVIFSDRENL